MPTSNKPKKTSKDVKVQLDDILNQLLIVVAQQLLQQAAEGENLKAAIDFLRLHRRSVSEDMVLGSTRDPNEYLNGLIEELGSQGRPKRDRR